MKFFSIKVQNTDHFFTLEVKLTTRTIFFKASFPLPIDNKHFIHKQGISDREMADVTMW